MATSKLHPPSEAKSRAMRNQRERGTEPELALRRELHRLGLRYRLHQRVVPGTRREVDIVFPKAKVAVDVRGCFWHSCPEHATQPASNANWWSEKLRRNAKRDNDTERRLAQVAWLLVVVWEHEDLVLAAETIADRVQLRVTAQAFRP